MANTTVARPELFNQIEAGKILKLRPKTVGEIAPRLGCQWKRDPHRSGVPRFLDRSDIIRMGRKLSTTPDWNAVMSA